jgi:NagD protein
MTTVKPPIFYLLDMDGVLVRGGAPIEGSIGFVKWLVENQISFQIFTNNSRFTPANLATRMRAIGFPIQTEHIYTSALATAHFIMRQASNASAFVIGESGLIDALHEIGCRITDNSPDYVLLGEAQSYDYEQIATGVHLVRGGARFIATNPDVCAPTERGLHPACGAVAALIEQATGRKPYFIGKPNPFMMRSVLDKLGAHAKDSVMVGDRMDTDVVAGLESGLRTVLVLTGVSERSDLSRFSFSPDIVVERLADLKSHVWC